MPVALKALFAWTQGREGRAWGEAGRAALGDTEEEPSPIEFLQLSIQSMLWPDAG